MTLAALKTEIAQLPDDERWQLLEWLDERENDAWDRDFERDFSPGGPGEKLMEQVDADIAAGRTIPMEDLMAEAESESRS